MLHIQSDKQHLMVNSNSTERQRMLRHRKELHLSSRRLRRQLALGLVVARNLILEPDPFRLRFGRIAAAAVWFVRRLRRGGPQLLAVVSLAERLLCAARLALAVNEQQTVALR